MRNFKSRIDKIEDIALAITGNLEKSVYGIVDRVDNVDGELVPHCIRKWKGTIGDMHPTDEEPTIFLIEKLEPCILKHKKYKCLYGGRGGTKSRMAQDVCAGEINSQGSKIFVLRERMKSLKDSIYAGIENSIKNLKLGGFLSVPSKWEIRHKSRGKFVFGGLQNVIDMKGAADFKIFLTEEAARLKQATIDTLGPTLRDVKNAELWFLWNPESYQDPMSKEFINPYQADIDRYGYYEDDYHLIIKVGYEDNPWFQHDESLRTELEKDTQKLKDGRMSKARYNHIWKGSFNDDIENSIILEDWFNACIDAHKKLKWFRDDEPTGAKVVGFDPSDTGSDDAGYVERKGVVFTHVSEIEAENGNRKFDEAAKNALNYGVNSFGYDADGLGALLRDQAAKILASTGVHVYAYKGSGEVSMPNAVFSSENSNLIKMDAGRLNKDVFNNRKAQNITAFAERIYKTFEAVEHGIYHNPDELISFDSEKIKPEMLMKLKSEACKTPTKTGDKIMFYTKAELRKGIILPDGSRIIIPSPNLFDAAVLSFDEACIIRKTNTSHRPKPRKPMGAQKRCR